MYFLSTRNTRNSVASGLTGEINTAHITNHITTLRPLCCTTVAGSKKTSVFYAWSRKIEWTLFNEETSQKPIWDYKIGSIRSQLKWVNLNITDVGMLYWQKKKKKGIRETGNKTFKVKKPGEDSPFKNKCTLTCSLRSKCVFKWADDDYFPTTTTTTKSLLKEVRAWGRTGSKV